MEKLILPHTESYWISLQQRLWLTNRTFELELARPDGFDFIPGQRIHLQIGATGRDYSLVSSPGDDVLRLCIRHIPDGALTPKLLNIPMGKKLQISGPNGYFVFRKSDRPPIFVATGTGIAPFVSMALSGRRGFTLLHGIRSSDERYYADIFQRTADLYMPCITGSEQGSPDSYTGRITQYMAEELPDGEYDFYLCGRTEMIRDATRIVDRRFPQSKIFVELFF